MYQLGVRFTTLRFDGCSFCNDVHLLQRCFLDEWQELHLSPIPLLIGTAFCVITDSSWISHIRPWIKATEKGEDHVK